jgi:hypothetical protein
MKIGLVATVVSSIVVAPGLQAQYPRLDVRASPEVRAAVVPLLDSARAGGLPIAPLEDKVLEGITKQADAVRIAAAVRRLASELAGARAVLGERASVRALVAGAGALRAGFGSRDLARLRTARFGRDPAVALEVATDLATQGVAADTATVVVFSVLVAGASDADLEQLRLAVERDVAGGIPPSVAASIRARVLSGSGMQPDPSPPPSPSPRD